MKLLATLAIFTSGCALDNDGTFDDLMDPSNVSDPLPPRDRGEPDDVLPAACGDTEVHVIGVYETRSDHSFESHPIGDGIVRIARPGVHALVLSAYEPTRWKIELAAGARLRSIHLVGYHAQTVMPPHEDITITTDTYEQTGSGACGFAWPSAGQGCDTNELLALAKARTGAEVTSFHGCYHASQWTLGRDMVATSNCDRAAGYDVDAFHGTCAQEPAPTAARVGTRATPGEGYSR